MAAGFLVLYLGSRLLHIDADAPAWTVSYYSGPDELFYVNCAITSLQRNALVSDLLAQSPLANGFQLTNWTLNGAAWLSLKTFGLTYAGLRVAAVGLGLVVAIGIAWLTARGVERRYMPVAVGAALALLLTDFGYVLASRIVEPTIARLAAACATLAIVTRLLERHREPRAASLAVVAAITIALVTVTYPANAFLVPSMAVAILFTAWSEPTASRARLVARDALVWVGAAVVALVAHGLVYRLVFGHSIVDEIVATVVSSSARVATPGRGVFVKVLIENTFMIASANSFKAAPALLAAWLIALPVLAVQAYRDRRPVAIVLTSTQAFWFLQTAFMNDYPERKLVFITPFAIATVVVASLGAWDARTAFVSTPLRRRVSLAIVLFAAAAALASVVVGHFVGSLRGRPWWNGPTWFAVPQVLLVVAVAVAACAVLLGQARTARRLILGCALAGPLVSAALAYDVIYREPTFQYRDMMTGLAPTVHGHAVVGAISFSAALYSGGAVALSPYAFNTGKPEVYEGLLEDSLRQGRAEYVLAYPGTCVGFCISDERARSLGLREVARFSLPVNSKGEDRAILFENTLARGSR